MNRAAMYFFDHVRYPAEWEKQTDEDLLQLYRESLDQLIICFLLKRHRVPVVAISYSYLRNQEAIEDFVHNLFIKLVEKLQGAEVKNFKSFLITVVKNKHIDELGKYEVRQAHEKRIRERRDPFTDTNWDFGIDNPFTAEKLKELLDEGRLSQMEGTCLQLRAQGMKAGDIAKVVDPRILGLYPQDEQEESSENFVAMKKRKVFGALERAYKKMKVLLAQDYEKYFQN